METIPMTVRTPTGQILIQCPRPAHHLVNALGKIGAILKPDPVSVQTDGTVHVQLAGGGEVTASPDALFFGEVRPPAAAAPASAAAAKPKPASK